MLIWYPRLLHTGTFKETMKAFNEFIQSVSVVLSALQIYSLAGKFLLVFSVSLTIESNPNNKVQTNYYKQTHPHNKTASFLIGVTVFVLSLSACAVKHILAHAREVESCSKKKTNLSCLSCAFLFLMAFSLCESLGWLMGSCIVLTTLTSESSALQNALTRTHIHTYPTMSLSLFYTFSLSLYH